MEIGLDLHQYENVLFISPKDHDSQNFGRVSRSNGMLYYLVFTKVSSESKSAHHLYERFIPVEIFLKKVIPFESLPFSPFFLPKRSKFFCTICLAEYSVRLHVLRKRKLYRYFVNGTTQSRSCFRCQKKYQYHLTEIFHRTQLRYQGWTEACSLSNLCSLFFFCRH